MVVIGLMSGSSLDGIDLAACRFWYNKAYHFKLLAAETLTYSDDWEKALADADHQTLLDGWRLHQSYGLYLGQLIRDFQANHAITGDLVSSHGHTIYHQPQEGLSLQIGDASAIKAMTGLPVVNDFRQGDLHLGGQGAPLVPIGDAYLFPEYDVCLNLGGIANLSFATGSGERLAFDVAPANQVLNRLAQAYGKAYDAEGELARTGRVNPQLLDTLNALPFYHLSGPRSLDKKEIEQTWMGCINSHTIPVTDKLRTYTEHLALQVRKALAPINPDLNSHLLITGGGAWNQFLKERLQANWPGKLWMPEPELVNFKEALVFAFMGWLRFHGLINCFGSVTGASQDHVAGSLYG